MATTPKDGREAREATSAGRFYNITTESGDVVKLPSVTTILQVIAKPALVKWAENQGRDGAVAAASSLYEQVSQGGKTYSAAAFAKAVVQRIGQERQSSKSLA